MVKQKIKTPKIFNPISFEKWCEKVLELKPDEIPDTLFYKYMYLIGKGCGKDRLVFLQAIYETTKLMPWYKRWYYRWRVNRACY